MKLRPINLDGKVVGYMFFCPGCKEPHSFYTSKISHDAPVWDFNGDVENPTFAPSLAYRRNRLCHLFLTNGMLHFLADCHHEFASKTVALDEWPKDWRV